MNEGMSSNISKLWEEPSCNYNMTAWDQKMDKMYTYFYLLLFIPGLLLNTIALWFLCMHIRKKTKAVIFMINLALADLAHILSLPFRIYYYFTHTWPFGRGICLFCFYLKYLNMYAAIVFLVCISVQRCCFLRDPFVARRWRRRYDLLISVIVWIVVSLGCSPFILMRNSGSANSGSNTTQTMYSTGLNSSCFKDLPMRRLPLPLMFTMMALAEIFGFFIPLACISYSSIRIAHTFTRRDTENQQSSTLSSSARIRLQSVTSNSQMDKCQEKQLNGEKQRALRMVLSCSALFLLCFAPYHLNFMFYLMVSQGVLTNCTTTLAVKQFHPVSLCLASLSCCLNPLIYYFTTAEFRLQIAKRTYSFTSILLSSPVSSPTQVMPPQRMMSLESNCSDRESH